MEEHSNLQYGMRYLILYSPSPSPLEIQKYVQQGIINPDFDSLMKKTGVMYGLHSVQHLAVCMSTMWFQPWDLQSALEL